MNIVFLFARFKEKAVAEAAQVNLSTAYRWSYGRPAEWVHLKRLLRAGLLQWRDLRADVAVADKRSAA